MFVSHFGIRSSAAFGVSAGLGPSVFPETSDCGSGRKDSASKGDLTIEEMKLATAGLWRDAGISSEVRVMPSFCMLGRQVTRAGRRKKLKLVRKGTETESFMMDSEDAQRKMEVRKD